VGTEIREPPSFHGVNDLEELLTIYEHEVLENCRLVSLDIKLKETPARWVGHTKKQLRNSINVSNCYTLDLVKRREEMRCRDMMDRGHQ